MYCISCTHHLTAGFKTIYHQMLDNPFSLFMLFFHVQEGDRALSTSSERLEQSYLYLCATFAKLLIKDSFSLSSWGLFIPLGDENFTTSFYLSKLFISADLQQRSVKAHNTLTFPLCSKNISLLILCVCVHSHMCVQVSLIYSQS